MPRRKKVLCDNPTKVTIRKGKQVIVRTDKFGKIIRHKRKKRVKTAADREAESYLADAMRSVKGLSGSTKKAVKSAAFKKYWQIRRGT